jgi:hypothetical protein
LCIPNPMGEFLAPLLISTPVFKLCHDRSPFERGAPLPRDPLYHGTVRLSALQGLCQGLHVARCVAFPSCSRCTTNLGGCQPCKIHAKGSLAGQRIFIAAILRDWCKDHANGSKFFYCGNKRGFGKPWRNLVWQ